MLAVLGVVVTLSVVSSLLTTTSDERAEARRKFARWNPLFIALLIAQLAFIFWPRG
jgi:glucan phosphoethanolaminetransferase (alkaline phosphatase superfamily)